MKGKNTLAAGMARVHAKMATGATLGLDAVGLVLVGTAKQKILRGKKSGRVYTRRGVRHQASAPGESPANDTGRLAGSITHETQGGAQPVVTVAARTEYAAPLEFGTRDMAARPYLTPSIEDVRPQIAALVANAIRRSIAS